MIKQLSVLQNKAPAAMFRWMYQSSLRTLLSNSTVIADVFELPACLLRVEAPFSFQ
ncbi:protein of unknown function [Candidatus Nitrotoga arctica]|uniref:Uncharacterized protein n=1 Tax=Candidatus Nitrotoga arctica TaxID=453162 RepID=A0ABM8YXN7_9PROT|nr:protein of unknown function [Candidatus Nitrotoga arctica]